MGMSSTSSNHQGESIDPGWQQILDLEANGGVDPLLTAAAPLEHETAAITKALRSWYERAGVRVDPRRMMREEHREGLHYWPPALAGFVAHPQVVQRGKAVSDELLVRQLYQYLQFTANYEMRVINRATELIANGRSGLDLPASVRHDAYKIYCDEGYHAMYSFDVIAQVEQASGIEHRPFDFDATLRYLQVAQDTAPARLRTTVTLLVVIVFETLITATLTQIPRSGDVISLVREVVRDHAQDEGCHHAFFAKFFGYLWGQLSPKDRTILGPLLAEFIVRPLEPRLDTLRDSLAVAGLSGDATEEVVHDCFPAQQTRDTIRATAKSTLRLFARHGLYDDPGTREAFEARGLLVERA
jgi:hypothetical protein